MTKNKNNRGKGKQQPKANKSKIPISSIAKAVANYFGAGGAANGVIDSGVKALADFTNLPFGVRQRGRARGPRSDIAMRNAPAAIGFAQRTPDWDFNRAPDKGIGPGIRISGRFILGHIIDAYAPSASSIHQYTGLAPSAAEEPLQAVLFSPAAGYDGDSKQSPAGAFGSADSIHQAVCECFTRYDVVDAVIEYIPASSSATAKTVTIAWVSDAAVVGTTCYNSTQGTGSEINIVPITSSDAIMNIPDALTTSAWMPAQMRLPLDRKNKELLFINTDDFKSPALDDDNSVDQCRFLFPGGFLITGSGNTATAGNNVELGIVYANITLDIYQLAMNTAPIFAAGTTSGALTSSTVGSMSSASEIKSEPLAYVAPEPDVGPRRRFRKFKVARPHLLKPIDVQGMLAREEKQLHDATSIPDIEDLAKLHGTPKDRAERQKFFDDYYKDLRVKELTARLEGYPMHMDTSTDNDYVQVPGSKKRKTVTSPAEIPKT